MLTYPHECLDTLRLGGIITTLPTHGLLYPVLLNGSIAHTPLTASMVTIRNTAKLYGITGGYLLNGSNFQVAYRSSISALVANNPLLIDSFSYAVYDSLGLRSANATFTLSIRSALTTWAQISQPTALEHTTSSVALTVTDQADVPRLARLRIVSTPTRGVLTSNPPSAATTTTTGTSITTTGTTAGVTPTIPMTTVANTGSSSVTLPALTNGSLITSTTNATTTYHQQTFLVNYLGAPHYFTTPTVTWSGTPLPLALVAPDRFTFQAITADGSLSSPTTQNVTVQNINDPTTIQHNALVAGSPLVGGVGYTGSFYQVYALSGPATAASPGVVTVDGFNLTDPDLGVDIIKARVATTGQGGLVSLNPQHLTGLDFNSAKYCLAGSSSRRWKCAGKGNDDAEMVFLGTTNRPTDKHPVIIMMTMMMMMTMTMIMMIMMMTNH